MNKEKLIRANDFCANQQIEISFISSLQEYGLIEITTIEETGYIQENQLQQLERMVRLYSELNINIEGIDTINHLLTRITNLQNENNELRNRLRLYENDF